MPSLNRNAAKEIFLALLVASPFFMTIRTPPAPSFWMEWMAALILAIFSILNKNKSSYTITISPIQVLLIIFIVLRIFDILMVRYRYIGSSIIEIGYALISIYAISFFNKISLEKNQGNHFFQTIALGIVIACIFNFIISILQVFGLGIYGLTFFNSTFQGRVEGVFGQSNHLATFANLGLVATLYLKHNHFFKINTIRHILHGLMIAIIVMTGSRTGLVSFFAILTLYSVYCSIRKKAFVVNFLLLASTYILMSMTWDLKSSGASAISRLNPNDGRWELYRDGISIIQDNLLIGIGWRNFSQYRWERLSGELNLPNAIHSHNLILDVIVSWGLIGIAFIVIPLILIYTISLIQTLKSSSDNELKFFAFLYSSVVFIHCLLEWPYAYVHFLMIWLVFLDYSLSSKIRLHVSLAMSSLIKWGIYFCLTFIFFIAVDYNRYSSKGSINQDNLLSFETTTYRGTPSLAALTVFDFYYSYLYSTMRGYSVNDTADRAQIYKNIRSEIITVDTVAQYIEVLLDGKLHGAANIEYDRSYRNHSLRSGINKRLCERVERNLNVKHFLTRRSDINC